MKLWTSIVLVVASLSATSVEAGKRHHGCCAPVPTCCAPQPTCAPCGEACAPAPAPAMVEKTIWVPETTMEKRVIQVTEYKQEVKEREVEVQRMVPKKEVLQRTINYTEVEWQDQEVQCKVMKPTTRVIDVNYEVCVPVVEKKTGVRKVCTPVWDDVETEVTVMVPGVEKRNGVKCEMVCVPVVKKTMVCEDKGQWVQQPVETTCNTCAPAPCASTCGCPTVACPSACATSCAPCTRMVWVPNVVSREVEITCYQWERRETPYEYEVTVCRPTVEKRKVKVCRMESRDEEYSYDVTTFRREPRTCQKTICEMVESVEVKTVKKPVCVPKSRVEDYTVCTMECVTEKVKQNYTECVPVVTDREIEVPVCRMVERKIMVPAPTTCAPAPCTSCAPTCCH